MNAGFSIREATQNDLPLLLDLLRQCDLVTEGVLQSGTRYWVAESDVQQLIGLAGLEFGQDAVLLRSVGVHPDFQKRGIGTALVKQTLTMAAKAGVRYAYCFSTDAQTYWAHSGFRKVSVTELVDALPDAPQVIHFARIGWLPTEVAWRKDL